MKHAEIISQMTIEEKAAFLSGKNMWQTREYEHLQIPSIFCADGPHGVRKQAGAGDHLGLNASLPATCFPTASTISNSWDEALGEELGEALGREAASQEVDVLLGPGLNIKRSPLCGRNFEYFSEDPYLSGKMAASYIRGIQSQGVYACPKHFAVNSQELRRMASDSIIDERTLREIYLEGFEIAVKEGKANAIMSSYNEVNGIYANENKHLLQDILRDEWGFDGIVITDWGGSNDHVKGVAAGSNLEMPSPGLASARELLEAVEQGTLPIEQLDRCVDELLEAVLSLHNAKRTTGVTYEEAHHKLAKKAAVESAVLLKNEADAAGVPVLPLRENCKVALIGDFAQMPRYQGAGSSMVNPYKVETMEEQIREYALDYIGFAKGYHRSGEEDEALKAEAVKLAARAEIVIYCFGLDEIRESEGMDRNHMRISQNQIELLEALAAANKNIVGVLSAGSAIEMAWHTCCHAILHGYLGGQAGASAMLDLLLGKANPSGKLNESYPEVYEDTPAYRYFPGAQRTVEYRESLYVGYRYYETCQKKTAYPFGFGLSYTEFAYSEYQVTSAGVTLRITNTGKYDGAEIVQLYVGMPKSRIFRPVKSLKGFTKVFLKAGESREVQIAFDDKTFRYWNRATKQWEIEEGEYLISVGASVADIRLTQTLYQSGTTEVLPYDKQKLPFYYKGDITEISDKEYEELLGYKIPAIAWTGELSVNDAICQMYYAKSGLARFIYKRLTKIKLKSEAKGTPDLNVLFIYNMPFRGIAKMTNGMVSMEMVHGMVALVNGHFFGGMGKIIGGFFSNKRKNKVYERLLAELAHKAE
ncbi:MAG: glycoside hydrolase family 3 C-terminal domain-containing protein [Lachnospiraceae bacterium]